MKRAVLALFVFAACAPPPDEIAVSEATVESTQQEIYGGTAINGEPQVYGLRMKYSNGAEAGCTATLIGARTLLSAAHCPDGASEIYALNGQQLYTNNTADYIKVSEWRIHPGWGGDPGENADDLSLLLLSKTVSVTPKQWNMSAANVGVGKAVRMIGYGETETGSYGVKKETAQTIDGVTTHLLHFDQQNGHGVCSGDSGGPVFSTGADGVERVVGVASFVSGSCSYAGAHTRVDAYASWITQWLAEKETPQCTRDGLCKQGCTPVDIDCTCGADGECTTVCADPSLDPDCGPNCGADKVCTEAGILCATPDPDCKDLGALCATQKECPNRVCTNDSQHDENYCSTTCSATVACPEGFECSGKLCKKEKLPEAEAGEACTKGGTFCLDYTICAGKPSLCVEECEADSDCVAADNVCTGKDGAVRFCELKKVTPPPQPQQPKAAVTSTEPEPTPAGCSQSSPSWLLLALIVVARRRFLTRRPI